MKKKKTGLVLTALLLAVSVFLASCGDLNRLKEIIPEIMDEAISGRSDKADDETAKTSKSGKSSSSAKADTEDRNQYIEIPEGTVLIVYDGDASKVREELEEALGNREPEVCIKDYLIWFNNADFYGMPYSTFWLEDYEADGYRGKQRTDEEYGTYYFYHFKYYDLTDDELDEMKVQIDAAAEEIIAQIPEDTDDWTRAKVVHDELCRLVTYDESLEQPHCHDTYGALVNHLAVCSGYACAFSHIMALLGTRSPLSYSNDHAWNNMYVPSEECYIDVTWDDMDLIDAYGDPYIDYSCFFITREEVESIDSHTIESGDPFVTSSDSQPYNYYSHEGYLVGTYDWDEILRMYREQYETGTNFLTIRFETEEDYQVAKTWEENDKEVLRDILSELEYYGAYYYWYNDQARTVSMGLYAAAEEIVDGEEG